MSGYLALVLHAHLPFVRHPEHERFLEENWLFEAITETYIPLIQVMDGWLREGMETRLTLTLTPTLCSMLLDPLLQERYSAYLNGLIDLAEKETHRTHWDQGLRPLSEMYLDRFLGVRETYAAYGKNLVGAFRKFQEEGKLEIITCAATHALLPLLENYPNSLRAQILVARDHYRSCFGLTRAVSGCRNALTSKGWSKSSGSKYPLVRHGYPRCFACAAPASLWYIRAHFHSEWNCRIWAGP